MSFDHLPHNAKLSILLHLDYKGIMRMMVLSKSWLGLLSQNQEFWRQKFELDLGSWEGGEVDFEEECKIEYGWRFKKPKVVELEGHKDMIVCLKIKGSKMVSCSLDNEARVWDLDEMECLWALQEECAIHFVEFDGENVFAALQDGIIHMWNVRPRELCHSWQAHESFMTSLSLAGGRLVSSGLDSLRVWDTSTFECLRVFEVEDMELLSVDGDEIICWFWNERQVRVFHQEEGLLYTLVVDTGVFSACMGTRRIYVGCNDGHILVWDTTTRERIDVLQGGPGDVWSVWCNAKKLIFVTSNGCIKLWDSQTCAYIWQIDAGEENVRERDCGKDKVAIGSWCGKIQVFDFAC